MRRAAAGAETPPGGEEGRGADDGGNTQAKDF